jgi:hypothetical protein
MKKIILTMLMTFAFISVPYVDLANNQTGVQAGISAKAKMVLDQERSVRLTPPPVEKIKVMGLNEKLTKYSIPDGKKDKLFGLLLLAYGGKR